MKKTDPISPSIDGIFLIQLVILNAATPLTYHQVLPFAELWTVLALSFYAEAGSLSESKVVIFVLLPGTLLSSLDQETYVEQHLKNI